MSVFSFLTYNDNKIFIKLKPSNSFKFLVQKFKKKKSKIFQVVSLFNFFGVLKLKKKNNVFFNFNKSIHSNIIKNLKQNYVGFVQGYSVELLAVGVGYRFDKLQKKINVLVLNVGDSHYNYFFLPRNVAFRFNKNYLFLFGLDLLKVKKIALQIKSFRLPEPYKGNGIRYFSEIVEIKEGKKKK